MKGWTKKQPLLSLKPTQFALGMIQVTEKVKELKAAGKKGLRECLDEKPIPVVVSPNRELYLVDHHHFLYACWCLGMEKVKIEVRADLSRLRCNAEEFWETMKRSHWTHLYDQFGEGPRSPLYLPDDIRGLADDPYRSLAWAVREAGGYDGTKKTYAEFDWANFFRSRRLLTSKDRKSFARAVKKAVKLAKSSEAKALPGFNGR